MEAASKETPNPVPLCPDCRVEMEQGWQPDHVDSISVFPASWMSGIPEIQLMFGLHSGDRALTVKVWRCPECGLLRQYAIKPNKNWRKVD